MHVDLLSISSKDFEKEIERFMYDLVIESKYPDLLWLNHTTWISLGKKIFFDDYDFEKAKKIIEMYSDKVIEFKTYNKIRDHYINSLYITAREFFNVDGFDLLWRFVDILNRSGVKIASMFYDKEIQQFLSRFVNVSNQGNDDDITRIKMVYDRMATHLIAAEYLSESFNEITHVIKRDFLDDEINLIKTKTRVWYDHLESQEVPSEDYLQIKSYNLFYCFDHGYDIKDSMKVVLYSLLPHTIYPNQYPKHYLIKTVQEVLTKHYYNGENRVKPELFLGFRNIEFEFYDDKIVFKSRNKQGMAALFSEVVLSSNLAIKDTSAKKVEIKCSKKNSKKYMKII